MTTPDPQGPAGAAPQPPDERLRQQGVKLLTALSATLRVGRAYEVKNQAFARQLENLLEAVAPVLDSGEDAVLVMHLSDVYLNGVRIPVNQATFKYQQTVVELFQRLNIVGLKFEPGVNVAELVRFFDLSFRTDGPTGADLLTACTAQVMKGVVVILTAVLDPSQIRRGAVAPEDAAAAPGEGAAIAAPPPADTLETQGRLRHMQAMQGARLLLMPTSLQTSLQVRHAKRVVQPLVEGVSLSEPVVVGLSTLTQHDEFTYAHAVNVCGVAVAIGHFLGLDRRALSDLGVAALLHDVGKHEVGPSIANDFERFTPEERAAAERHTIEGAKLIARSTSFSPTTLNCMRVALEHHLGGPHGYPALPPDWKPSLLSQIVAVADCFVSLQGRLSSAAPSVSPHDALGMLLGPLATPFEPALLWALVRAVGFYPPGQIVELDDGSRAAVLAPNSEDPARPVLRVLVSATGENLPRDQQTEHRPLPPHRSIRRALKPAEYPRLTSDEGLQAA